jgi:PKD repeat protein
LLSAKSETATALEWRFDLQLMTSNVFFGVAGGLTYVPGTYHIFGNNGTTPYEHSVNNGSNTALNTDLVANATISAAQLYLDLTGASDHLPVVADYTVTVPDPPVASFIGSPTTGVVPLVVTFTDTSSGSITNWSWNFGDGGTTSLTTNSALYTYNVAGVYTVTEIVSGPGGSSTNTQVNYITVLTPFQAWQIQYFGSTNNPSAAPGADPDGDGQNNLAEFLAGTNPTNSASGLRITSVAKQGNDVLVTWTTAGGETNVVQATPGLPDGSYSNNFLDLSPLIIISGSGDTTTNYLDSGGATNAPARYYRIRLQP